MQGSTSSVGVSVPPNVFYAQLLPNVSSKAEADYIILCLLELISGYRVLFGIFQYSDGIMVNKDYYKFLQREVLVLEFYITELKAKREVLKG